MTMSIQLWSVRDALRDTGWDATLAQLRELGFTHVEPYAIHLLAEDLIPAIGRSGLETPTAHGFLDAASLDATLDVASSLGISTVFHPHLDAAAWRDAAALDETAEMLMTAADRARDRGIRVGFHNHDDELIRDVDGASAFWSLLDRLPDDIAVEYDAYWAAIAGVDIVAEVIRLGARAAALHIKDGPLGASAEDQVALGDGALPLEDILAAAPHALPVLSLDRMPVDAATMWVAIERSRAWFDGQVVR